MDATSTGVRKVEKFRHLPSAGRRGYSEDQGSRSLQRPEVYHQGSGQRGDRTVSAGQGEDAIVIREKCNAMEEDPPPPSTALLNPKSSNTMWEKGNSVFD